jgi:hypothetical protein
MVSFHADGTEAATGQGSVMLKPPPGSVKTDSFGAWVQLDWHTFGYTDQAVISDLDSNLIGFFKVRGIYTRDGSGNRYTGRSYFEFLDAHHRPTGTASWACNEGVRISVEQPPTDPLRPSSVYRNNLNC